MSPKDPRDLSGGVPRGEFDYDTPTDVRTIRILEGRVQRLELRDANMFGVDDDDGMWQRHKQEHNEMKGEVEILKTFRAKTMLMVTLGGSALGLIAGFAAIIIEKLLGK